MRDDVDVAMHLCQISAGRRARDGTGRWLQRLVCFGAAAMTGLPSIAAAQYFQQLETTVYGPAKCYEKYASGLISGIVHNKFPNGPNNGISIRSVNGGEPTTEPFTINPPVNTVQLAGWGVNFASAIPLPWSTVIDSYPASNGVPVGDGIRLSVSCPKAGPDTGTAYYTNIAAPLRATPAVEYFHAGFGHYFVTANPKEIEGLDGGAYNGAFQRTGESWNVYATGSATEVCRFFTTPGAFGAKGSHFYTADAVECAGLKHNPNWIYENIAFKVVLPIGESCPAGHQVLYRLFNNGQSGAPNHRYTTSREIRADMIHQGWAPEDGNSACVPI